MREALLALRDVDDQVWLGAKSERPQVVTHGSVALEDHELFLRGRAPWNKRVVSDNSDNVVSTTRPGRP
jgi:hypothetical protein